MKNTLLILIFLFLTACQTTAPYDYTKLNNSKPRSILVIPPLNNSLEVNAPYTFLSTISRPLAEKGYYVLPVAVVDLFFKENGLPTPVEMNSVSLDKIRTITGADAVLYVTINNWGQNFQVFSSVTVTSSTAKLVDTQTGELLWDARFHFEQGSDDGGAGLVGALVSAVATQIASSVSDNTPAVSRTANAIALNNKAAGLLPGPYLVIKEESGASTP